MRAMASYLVIHGCASQAPDEHEPLATLRQSADACRFRSKGVLLPLLSLQATVYRVLHCCCVLQIATTCADHVMCGTTCQSSRSLSSYVSIVRNPIFLVGDARDANQSFLSVPCSVSLETACMHVCAYLCMAGASVCAPGMWLVQSLPAFA
jgi:hypothetical protein